jgi:tetratricopeptide (TPR) repeat protein
VGKWTQADVNAGIEYLRQAVDRDPNYAAAYAALCFAYTNGEDLFFSPNDSMPKASEAAKKALELDESLPEAHQAMAEVDLWYDYDWPSAEREFKRAIELAPRNADVLTAYGWCLTLAGQLEHGIEEAKRGLGLDPLSLENNIFFGGSLYEARRYDEAAKQLRATVDIEPNYYLSHLFLGMSYEQHGDLPSALDELQKANRLESEIPWPLAELGHAYAQSGRKDEAERVLQELTRRAERGYVSPYFPATVYVGLGKKEQALTLLEKAYADRSGMLTLLKADPELDPLRSEPRFVALLRRMGQE